MDSTRSLRAGWTVEIIFPIPPTKIWCKCNYDVMDLNLRLTNFYMQLLTWWADFRNTFSDSNYFSYIIWNNKDVRIGNKPDFL